MVSSSVLLLGVLVGLELVVVAFDRALRGEPDASLTRSSRRIIDQRLGDVSLLPANRPAEVVRNPWNVARQTARALVILGGSFVVVLANPGVNQPSGAVLEATAKPSVRPPTSHDALARCPKDMNCFVYAVGQGDDLLSIARWFGLSSSEVLSLNPQIRDPKDIHPGDLITLARPRD